MVPDNKLMATNKYHKLNNRWKLWSHLPNEPNWTDLNKYQTISTYESVEECIAINEILPDKLIQSCMLFVMKNDILPMWEDKLNINGGCFSYKIHNKYICEVWKSLTYALVGETITNNKLLYDCITGITISPQKNFCVVKIWMTNCNYQNPSLISSEIKYLSSDGCLFKKHKDNIK